MIDYVKPQGNTLFEKVESAVEQFYHKIGQTSVDTVVAEQPNIMFQAGRSSASTISKILRFNGAFLFTICQSFRILPQEVMAISARKAVIGRGRFAPGLNPKEEVWKWVNQQATIQWPIGRTGNFKPERFDMADSAIVAWYGHKFKAMCGTQTEKVGVAQ